MKKKQLGLDEIFKLFLHFWYIPIILALIGGFFSYKYAQNRYTSSYTAKSTIIVKPKEEDNHYLQQQVSGELQLIPTYHDFITSNDFMNTTHKKLKKQYAMKISLSQLQKQVVVTTKNNSLIMTIESTDSKKSRAVKQANTVARVFKQQISKISTTSQMNFLSRASKKNVKISEFSGKKALLYGAILGVVLGLFVDFMLGVIKIKNNKI